METDTKIESVTSANLMGISIKKIFSKQVAKTATALFILCLLLSLFRFETFFTVNNMFNIFRQASINAVIVVGIAFVLLTGGIDLSVGSVAGFASLMTAISIKAGLNVLLSLSLGLSIGGVVGFLSGILITKIKVPPFIATLTMLTTFRGVIMVLSQGQPVTKLGLAFSYIGTGYIGPIPFPVIVMLILVAIAAYILKYTRFGRYVYAVGGNEEASRLSGINTHRIIITCYVLSGFMASISGMIMASRVDSATPLAGDGAELDAIAAAVIGGISLAGGKGIVVGGLIGALIIAVLNNGMILMDVSVFYTKVVKGVVILLAVILDSLSRAKAD